MKHAIWYFDFISPFAYLQSRMLGPFERKAEIEPVPVLFAALLDRWKSLGPAELPAKRVFTYRYCHWFAQRHGIPFLMPPAHPFPPLGPLRLALALGCDRAAIDTIFAAIWAEGRDLADPAEWDALCRRLGLDDAEGAIGRPEIKDRLRSNTEAALARGVWGVPTLAIDGALFWGADATDMALDYLRDPGLLERRDYARLGALPIGRERRRD